MLKNIRTVLGFEFVQQLRKKSFRVSTIVIAVVIAFLVCLPAILAPVIDKTSDSSAVSSTISGGVYCEDDSLKDLLPFSEDQFYDSEEALEAAVSDGTEPIGYVVVDTTHIKTIYANLSVNSSAAGSDILSEILKQAAIGAALEQYDVPLSEYYALQSLQVENETVVLGKDTTAQLVCGFTFVILVYMVILLYGQMVSTNVAREKDNKTMELLITSVSPDALILGKVFALILVILMNLAIFLACAAVPYELLHSYYPEVLKTIISELFSVSELWIYILFFLIGLVLYMFLFAALGSTVSRVEDVSSALTPLMMFIIIGYFLAFMQMSGVDNQVINAVSWFPFFSILMMPIRYANATVGLAGLLVSGAIDVLCAFFMAWVSIRIYRWGSLNYGNKPGLRSVLRQTFRREEQ